MKRIHRETRGVAEHMLKHNVEQITDEIVILDIHRPLQPIVVLVK